MSDENKPVMGGINFSIQVPGGRIACGEVTGPVFVPDPGRAVMDPAQAEIASLRAELAERTKERDEVWRVLTGIDLGKPPTDMVTEFLRDAELRSSFLKAWRSDLDMLLERSLAASDAPGPQSQIPGVVPGSSLESALLDHRDEVATWPEWLRKLAGLASGAPGLNEGEQAMAERGIPGDKNHAADSLSRRTGIPFPAALGIVEEHLRSASDAPGTAHSIHCQLTPGDDPLCPCQYPAPASQPAESEEESR